MPGSTANPEITPCAFTTIAIRCPEACGPQLDDKGEVEAEVAPRAACFAGAPSSPSSPPDLDDTNFDDMDFGQGGF